MKASKKTARKPLPFDEVARRLLNAPPSAEGRKAKAKRLAKK
jgi:hypothetical protein